MERAGGQRASASGRQALSELLREYLRDREGEQSIEPNDKTA
jgi:hypothetical protein